MAKKVLITSTSLRGGSNSDILANECAKGAKEAGHDVELLSLKGKEINYCIGCLPCQKTEKINYGKKSIDHIYSSRLLMRSRNVKIVKK